MKKQLFSSEFIRTKQVKLLRFLSQHNIDIGTIMAMAASGYYMSDNTDDYIFDSFYDSHAMLSINIIKEREFHDEPHKKIKPVFEVSSLKEAQEVFHEQTKKLNPELVERFAFRGVNKEYFFKRPYPNPWVCDSNGFEPSLISSFWRCDSAKDYYINRPINKYQSILMTYLADPLIYKGIDVVELTQKINAKYGSHSISDLVDFPDGESQEYYRRFMSHKIYGKDGYTLEQHYGMKTPVLDVTFDLPSALFFALYKFTPLQNGNATYRLNNNKDSAVYCVLYSDPPLKSSNDTIDKLIMFEHLKPIRPIRQKCAVAYQGCLGINEAAFFIAFKLKLSNDFDMEGIPRQEELFPSVDEDEFYKELLLLKDKWLKEKRPNEDWPEYLDWSNIVRYE